jgi:3-oxoacyl-[acyl-carrier protein] reductase
MPSEKRVAIVTGSSSGIGASTALDLAGRGWNVVINYSKSLEAAQQVVAQCVAKGAEAIAVQADVSSDADCRRLAQSALDKWGRIDALVNNAGSTKFVPHHKLDDLSGEDFLRIYSTNVVSAFQMSRACAPALKASGHGAIVNISSIAAQWGTGSSIAYGASKGALNSMTYSLARVLGPEVRVNAVLPGYVDTPWQRNHHGVEKAAAHAERYASHNPLKASCSPEEVAESIVWLIVGAPKTTGQLVYVDGGTHMVTPR